MQYLVAVADSGQFTRAAEALRVAQPSVSSAVRALERELDVDLFHRSGGHVSLTTAGEALLPWARQVLADCEAGRSAVRELLGLRRGRLALGATPSLTTNLMPPVLSIFHQQYPGIDLELEEAGSRDLVTRLEQGRMDLALLILPVDRPGLVTRALVEEELVLAVGHAHPLAGRQVIGLPELAVTPLVMFREGYDLREVVIAACRRVGRRPTIAAGGLEMGGVLAMTAAGLGAAIVPSSVVVPGGALHAVRFRGRSLSRTVGVAHRRDRPLSQAALALIEVLDAQVGAGGT